MKKIEEWQNQSNKDSSSRIKLQAKVHFVALWCSLLLQGGSPLDDNLTKALPSDNSVSNGISITEQSSHPVEGTQNNQFASRSIGPSQPIGQKPRGILPPSAKLKNAKSRNAQPSTEVAFEKISLGHGMAPLVQGQYGFDAQGQFTGTPQAFVKLGNSAPSYGIVVEKLFHRLTLFRLEEDGNYSVVKTFRAITGKDPEDKKSVGDFRTPEGIYFVTGSIADKVLPPKYGRGAFVLDYPNIFDLRAQKSGYGIWIHGTDDPKRLKNPFDTEGCVVVSNEDLLELRKYLVPFEVPIVISKEMTGISQTELEGPRMKALEMIEAWRTSWEKSQFDSYIGFYSPNFRSLGKSRSAWENFKVLISKRRSGNIKVTLSEPKILAYDDQLLAVFNQEYESKELSDFGKKFLYLKWEKDRYRIIAEKWYPRKKERTAQNSLFTESKAM